MASDQDRIVAMFPDAVDERHNRVARRGRPRNDRHVVCAVVQRRYFKKLGLKSDKFAEKLKTRCDLGSTELGTIVNVNRQENSPIGERVSSSP